ncbi:MAG TPA: histidine phosphatase family protein [Xanthomonadaceae bacterium]|nr:histidine phosphatase family protein [Xanthomonadaceae bacterium]
MRPIHTLALFATLACAAAAHASDADQHAFLIRHAEAGDGDDPILSEAGAQRADGWHAALGAPELFVVYATPTRRALQTARAIAEDSGAELRQYEHGRLDVLAVELRTVPGNVVVVGHSNTTPELAELLGVEPGEPIAHDEHDRVYRVDLDAIP